MKITSGGLLFSDYVDFKSIEQSLESDLKELDRLNTQLNCILKGEDFVGMEGLLLDTASTIYNTAKGTAKLGSKSYGAINKAYKQGKNKWKTYFKPLLTKTIKEIGSVLQNMFMKFSRFGKRYTELGKQINFVLTNQLKQVGTLPQGISVRLHKFEAYVLKGYIDMIESYDEMYTSVIESFAPKYMDPDKTAQAIQSKKFNDVSKASASIGDAVSRINQYGDISIPWMIFSADRYASFFKGIVKRKPSRDEIQGSLSDFVKKTILSEEIEYEFDAEDRTEFIRVSTWYLKIMSSILNNNVLEQALNKGGKSIKDNTKKLFTELDKVSNAASSIPEAPNEPGPDENGKVNQQKQADPNTFSREAIDAYIENTTTLITKTATVYSGIVRGTLASMFDLITETENLIGIINQSVGSN